VPILAELRFHPGCYDLQGGLFKTDELAHHVAQMRRDKRVRYESRKNIADHRPRVKGRFVKTASEIVNNTTLGK